MYQPSALVIKLMAHMLHSDSSSLKNWVFQCGLIRHSVTTSGSWLAKGPCN